MEIIIPTLSEIEEVIEKCLDRRFSNSYLISQKEPSQDRIGLKEAIEITGLKQSAIYKMTMQGAIPYEKFGKRLVFSRRELETWIQEKTVRKQSPEEIASQHLAAEARKKMK
jgi:excisionase family DNA binding protein